MDFFAHTGCICQNSNYPSTFFLDLDFSKSPMHLVCGNRETDSHFYNPNKVGQVDCPLGKNLQEKILPALSNTQMLYYSTKQEKIGG